MNIFLIQTIFYYLTLIYAVQGAKNIAVRKLQGKKARNHDEYVGIYTLFLFITAIMQEEYFRIHGLNYITILSLIVYVLVFTIVYQSSQHGWKYYYWQYKDKPVKQAIKDLRSY